MSLVEIRSRALEQVDWAPTQSTEFLALFDRMVNRAYNTLFTDAPFLLEQTVRIVTQPDVRNVATAATDLLNVNATDRRVLERVIPIPPLPFTGAAWDTVNKTWDGRWIEVTDPKGQVHRRRTREWWRDITTDPLGNPTSITDRVSIEEPWPNATDDKMGYRVYTPEYTLPPETVEIKSARYYGDSNHRLEVASPYDMERYQLSDFQGRTIGLPELIYRNNAFQLAAPTRAPGVTVTNPNWLGPENAGKFDFLFTYVWGNKDPDLLTPLGLQEPKWESGPSPTSATATTTNAGSAIILTLPNVDFELGFRSGLVSANRSGLRKRIYVRRYTSDVGGGISNVIESPEVFMLLDEIPGNTETYTWRGAIQPDYLRRFRRVHSYQSITFYPMPDDRYEIDCRVQYRPESLVNGQDAARLNDDALDALVQKTLAFFYTYDGKPELGQMAEAAYQDRLRIITKRYGIIGYAELKKRPARVGRAIGTFPAKSARYTPPT